MERRLRFTLLVLALVLASSCKGSKKGPLDDKGTTTEKTLPLVQENGAEANAGERQFDEDLVKSLIDRWLTAQNSGAFEAYSDSYASRFSGVKKVGTRSLRMDRAQWLADREQMFKKEMRVQALNIETTLSGDVAVLRFDQHWASKNYQDRGPKIMTLVIEDGQPKIAREEMLSSRVLGTLDSEGRLPLHIVHQVGRTAYAIVGEGASTLAPELHNVEGGYEVLGPADLSKAPEMKAWQQRQMRLFDAAGGSCDTVTGEVYALGRVLPHFGKENQWEREKTSKKERTSELFSMSAAQFAVELPSAGPHCGEPVLAQLVTDKLPKFAVEFDDGDLYQAAFEAFKKEPEVKKLAAEYKSEPTENGDTDWMDVRPVRKSVQLFEFPQSKKRFVWVSLHTGDGCGGWEGGHAMLYEVGNGTRPSFKALGFNENGGYPLGRLRALLDADGDGELEYLHHASIGSNYALFQDHGRAAKSLNFSNWDCSC